MPYKDYMHSNLLAHAKTPFSITYNNRGAQMWAYFITLQLLDLYQLKK